MNKEEAIEVIRKNWPDASFTQLREALEALIPELNESKNERIRKSLLEFLDDIWHRGKNANFDRWGKHDCASWIAYLEKQKEQKPVEWKEDWREEDIQTRFAFYTYKDDPSVLYLSNVFVEEASRNHGFGTKILKAAEKVAETIGATTISLKVKQDSPANTWYRKNGYGYVAFEDGYDWLEKNLEYMKPVKSAEWSEEDKEMLDAMIDIVSNSLYEPLCPREGMLAWLKSLRPSWKPSEEQMRAVFDASERNDKLGSVLRNLYEDLKELM